MEYNMQLSTGTIKIVSPFSQIKHFYYEVVDPIAWYTHGKVTHQKKLQPFIRGSFVFEDECVMIGKGNPYMIFEEPDSWYLKKFDIEVYHDHTVHVFKRVFIEAPKQIKNTECYEQWIVHVDDRPFNDRCYHITTDKLLLLGWKVKFNFNEGLSKILQWYLKGE